MSSECGMASKIEPMKNLPNEDSPPFSKDENSLINGQENLNNDEEDKNNGSMSFLFLRY